MHCVKVFFDNKRGVKVTSRMFSTLLKDEDLSVIVSVRVGREPLYLTGVSGLALIGSAFALDDLLHTSEQMYLIVSGALLIAAGYALASLTIGTLFNEKTVWWHDYWTVQKIRKAIRHAKSVERIDASTRRLSQPV